MITFTLMSLEEAKFAHSTLHIRVNFNLLLAPVRCRLQPEVPRVGLHGRREDVVGEDHLVEPCLHEAQVEAPGPGE
ncbi:MAG: hypothetical protein LM590_12050 [Thermofilum sp.]|nr:hypothetical protein [Thermofilum sp.]